MTLDTTTTGIRSLTDAEIDEIAGGADYSMQYLNFQSTDARTSATYTLVSNVSAQTSDTRSAIVQNIK